jgi:hypothetical protein
MSYWHISVAVGGVIGQSPWFLRGEKREHCFFSRLYFRVLLYVLPEKVGKKIVR